MEIPRFKIAAVERDTGLSKDVLRMWERRYGFPMPVRDEHGERCYPADQVERLRIIKRLMNQGYRPGKLISLTEEALNQLTPRRPRSTVAGPVTDELEDLLQLLKQHEAVGYRQALQHRLTRKGCLLLYRTQSPPFVSRLVLPGERSFRDFRGAPLYRTDQESLTTGYQRASSR